MDTCEFLEAQNLLQYVNMNLKLMGKSYICKTCKKYLLGSKMPPLCFRNELEVPKRPECIVKLKNLERQLLKKSLPFLKLRKLPKTRMDVTNDRLINIPISDDDIIKNVTSLPRTSEMYGII